MTNGEETADPTLRFYAETYDASVPDWPGEIDFYRRLIDEAPSDPPRVLEIAAGTGRIAIRLAEHGAEIVGLDRSTEMLRVARAKSEGLERIRWVEADMRSFRLDERFDIVIVPAHSFQNLVTVDDQVASLESMRAHLRPGGRLVLHLDHQDVDWLGDLTRDQGGAFRPEESFKHPGTGKVVRPSRAWWYERSTQTASTQVVWEELDGDAVVERHESRTVRLHCAFPFEVHHLLARCGFSVVTVMGDFTGAPLSEASSEMIFLARLQDPDA